MAELFRLVNYSNLPRIMVEMNVAVIPTENRTAGLCIAAFFAPWPGAKKAADISTELVEDQIP